MAAVLEFRSDLRRTRDRTVSRTDSSRECKIMIFPGVRVERHTLDLSHRVVRAAGEGEQAHSPSDERH